MKRTLLLCAVVAVTSVQVFADSYPMAVGPSMLFKVGVDAGSIPTGYKTGVTFNGVPDLGAQFYFPFTKLLPIGATLDVGLQTYGFVSKPNAGASDNNTYTFKYHYFAFSPSFVASVVSLGFSFCIPMSVSIDNTAGTQSVTGTTYNKFYFGQASDMATIVDAHIGVVIPIINDNLGRLNFLFFASYVLTGMDAPPTGGSISFSPVAASAGVGFNYLFKIGD